MFASLKFTRKELEAALRAADADEFADIRISFSGQKNVQCSYSATAGQVFRFTGENTNT